MPAAFALLIGAQLAGEILRRSLHLPLPGPVIGMFLLALLLLLRHRDTGKADAVPAPLAQVAQALITNMGLLFIPAGVGITTEIAILRQAWLPIIAGLIVSTVLGLIVTALVMHHVTRMTQHGDASASSAEAP